MPTFSKFIAGQRGSQQLVDSDGYIYSRKKPKDTALSSAWRCRRNNPPTKCPCHAYLALLDNSLSLGAKLHNHAADEAAPQRREFVKSLKRKAAEQPLLATQNLISEALAESSTVVNQTLPNIKSLAQIVRRSRRQSEANTSTDVQQPQSSSSDEAQHPVSPQPIPEPVPEPDPYAVSEPAPERKRWKRGVFTTAGFKKGDFLMTYEGDVVHWLTSCPDATVDNSNIGELINHGRLPHTNCIPKTIAIDGVRKIYFVASRDITQGEELRWNYGYK